MFARLAVCTLVSVCSLLLAACGDEDASPTAPATTSRQRGAGSATLPKLTVRTVGQFDSPVQAVSVPGTDLIAVVEKGGRVLVVEGLACVAHDKCPTAPATSGRTVVDLRSAVSTGSEQGLLGLAFHPRWPDDPRIFLNYTDRDGDTRIEAWELPTVSARARRERELLRIEQPYDNHNGGHLAFGPDGLLYIGMGDGGAGGDPEDRAQQPQELLGKMLRLDIEAGGERGYAIPEGNLEGGAPEVWALGLRNPWRYSFDRETGDLWIGDVGQDEREEIDALETAALEPASEPPNFQWRQREGFAAFDDTGARGPGRQQPPVLDYGRDDGCSVTGGVVYRGDAIPDLHGWYVFADFCGKELRFVRAKGVPGSDPKRGAVMWTSVPGLPSVASFGETRRGEVLVVSLDGTIAQIVAAR